MTVRLEIDAQRASDTGPLGRGTEIDAKRFYVPGATLRDECPLCKHPWALSLDRHPPDGEPHDYLHYPRIGEPVLVDAFCQAPVVDGAGVVQCNGRWAVEVVLKLSIEVVTP